MGKNIMGMMIAVALGVIAVEFARQNTPLGDLIGK